MDQVRIQARHVTKTKIEIIADPKVRGYQDLLIKGGSFYAVYDDRTGLWSQNLQVLSELIDNDIQKFLDTYEVPEGCTVVPRFMQSISNGSWTRYMNSMKHMADSPQTLNQRMMFDGERPNREDYATAILPYRVSPGPMDAYEELMSTLYAPEEREKLEWGIGALIDGRDIDKIQKMFVIYGDPGTGKSTVLTIMERMFPGYIAYFSAEELGKGYQFATAAFKSSPLIGIQHDGDLSKLWNNTLINEIAAHEELIINEKGIRQYTIRPKTMLFLATNKPVRITDSKSGLIRRLIDIRPTGQKIPAKRYFEDLKDISFELGAIAHHCLQVYRSLGPMRYDGYVPLDMIAKTNDVYNFISDHLDLFDDHTMLNDIWKAYKAWAEDSNLDHVMKKMDLMYEVASYFETMHRPDPSNQRSTSGIWYEGFKRDKFVSKINEPEKQSIPDWLSLNSTESKFDILERDRPAQYAAKTEAGNPLKKWDSVTTTLKDIDTKELHWVKVPENHIVIDFDLRGDDGKKSLEKNIEAASHFPPTYAEKSKSGNGLHLHYFYDGDATKLKNLYDVNIEIKVYKGNASLRRKLSECNALDVAHISSGLPLKGEKTVINDRELKDEMHIRNIIRNAMQKKYCPGTKPSIDFICKILDEAYESEISYDVSDMHNAIVNFAMNSTHWSDYCLQVVANMKFKSENLPEGEKSSNDDILTFYDVEVFPNLFLISFMDSNEEQPHSWINPPRKSVLALMDKNLVGFNNRKYDNHVVYAWAVLGYGNQQLYHLSQRIVSNDKNACFSQAFNLSYTDIYDFSAKKQSLKKWEIELGIDHHELGMPWDKPVPSDKWPLVQSYCEDDVRATKAVFDHLKEDFTARKTLAALSGLTVNDTTNTHTAKIIFGDEKNPQTQFNYPDLSELFPGYRFDQYSPKDKKSFYMGEYPGEGGYVFVYGMDNGYGDYSYMEMKHPWDTD